MLDNEIRREFKEEDFTEGELMLLKHMFSSTYNMLQNLTIDGYGDYLQNDLFYLTKKLGVSNIVD